MEDYAKLVVFVDSRQIEQVTSIQMGTESGQIEVYNLETGLAGFTPGPGKVSITLGYTVPVGGFEEPFQKYCVDGAYHTIQIGCGKDKYVGTGKFMNDNLSQSVSASTEGSVTWTGTKSAFK